MWHVGNLDFNIIYINHMQMLSCGTHTSAADSARGQLLPWESMALHFATGGSSGSLHSHHPNTDFVKTTAWLVVNI